MSPTLLVITGPTAIGKSSIAIQLATDLHTEILSADSRQFFREMNIGTAKPTRKELKLVTHHFINNISIHDDYDAGRYESEAIILLEKLFTKHSVIILCGGSGMYVDAVCKGFDVFPETDDEYRKQLQTIYHAEGLPALQKLLLTHDPEHYKQIDRSNPQRLMRALEITLSTGKPYSSFRKGQVKKRNFTILKVGITCDRNILNEKINKRVDAMMQQGLFEEAFSLYPARRLNALQTVGYKELFDHIDGKHNLSRAIDLIKQNTRRFAKRQMTWFRKDDSTIWMNPEKDKNIHTQIIRLIRKTQ